MVSLGSNLGIYSTYLDTVVSLGSYLIRYIQYILRYCGIIGFIQVYTVHTWILWYHWVHTGIYSTYLDTAVSLGSYRYIHYILKWVIEKLALKGLYRKNERGYRMKPENLRFWTIHIRHVPVSRNWHKTVSNFTKTGICQILYKSCSIKQIIFNNYNSIMSNVWLLCYVNLKSYSRRWVKQTP